MATSSLRVGLSVSMAFLLLLAAVTPAMAGEIRIGAGLNITGPTASQGTLFRKAILLAQKQINAAGGDQWQDAHHHHPGQPVQ